MRLISGGLIRITNLCLPREIQSYSGPMIYLCNLVSQMLQTSKSAMANTEIDNLRQVFNEV